MKVLMGIILLVLIVITSGVVVDIFERFVSKLPLKKNKLAPILIGFSLSLPELFVGISAAIDGKSEMALGNVVGANMANLSLIVGGLAIFASVVPVVGEYLEKDLWMTIGLAFLPFLMLTDGTISRLEGGVLVALYFVYTLFFLRDKPVIRQSKKKISSVEVWGLTAILFLSLLIMATSSWQLVQIAVEIATFWEVSWFWMGLMLIAFGTTLPELLLVGLSKNKKNVSVVLPDLLGSAVMNSTIILGIVALISPVILKQSLQRGLSGVFLVVILGLFWLFTKSKRKLERWEGVVLIGFYLMFIGLQFLMA